MQWWVFFCICLFHVGAGACVSAVLDCSTFVSASAVGPIKVHVGRTVQPGGVSCCFHCRSRNTQLSSLSVTTENKLQNLAVRRLCHAIRTVAFLGIQRMDILSATDGGAPQYMQSRMPSVCSLPC